MRSEPDHAAERVNQCLFGDVVETLSARKGFVRIRQHDGYRGWADRHHLRSIGAAAARTYRTAVNRQVVSRSIKVYDRRGKPAAPYLLYYGTAIRATKGQNGLACLRLPDGAMIFVKRALLGPISKNIPPRLTGSRLVAEAGKFLGVPYLWGGVTTTGLDCSGLVRAVCRRFGINMPRDTKEQISVGRAVPSDRIRVGDLLFFQRHVGWAFGAKRILHASLAAGGVRIESLDEADPACRHDLVRHFAAARRIL
jgi:hypothetical protein